MALSDNMRGALFMVASMTAFTVNDACMKALSDALPLFQAMFIRSALVVICLAAAALYTGAFRIKLPKRDWQLIGLRSAVEMGAAFFFISALFNMPIANVTAIIQALPLTVTLAGAVFLGEAVGWRRMIAILIGFCGVMLIVRPGGEGFSSYSLYVLAAVGCVTVRDLASRKMSKAVPSMTVAISAALAVLVFSGVFSLGTDWQPVTPRAGLQMAGAASFIVGGYIFSFLAMRSGEIGFVAPFRYVSLLAALLIGLFFFDEWPTMLTLLGSAIVVGTGLFTLYREQKMQVIASGNRA